MQAAAVFSSKLLPSRDEITAIHVRHWCTPLPTTDRGWRQHTAPSIIISSGPIASDDAILPQLCDNCGVEAEPVGQHLSGVLAKQRRRLDFGGHAVKPNRP